MTPAALSSRTLHLGASWVLGFTLRLGGVALDLTGPSVTVTLRLLLPAGGVPITRSTATPGETRWITDGTDGGIEFLFAPASTALIGPGPYAAEIVYEDTSTTPLTKTLHAQGLWVVAAPRTGAI